MINIDELLKTAGVEIPADKMEAFKKDFAANYKTVAEFEKKEAKITSLTESLNTVEASLKAYEGKNPDDLQKEIAALQAQIKESNEKYQKDLNERDLNDAITREMDKLKFTSKYARESVEKKIRGEGITFKDGKLYGFSDKLAEIRESDAEAFVNEEEEAKEQSRVKFTSTKDDNAGSAGVTLDDYRKLKTSEERQDFIAKHPTLFRHN